MTIAIEVLWPSRAQESGPLWARVRRSVYLDEGRVVPAHRRVATVVLRNVSDRLCYAGWALTFTIRDRAGGFVQEWHGITWLAGRYQPGEDRTFSLPGVQTCHRHGPFVAYARVGHFQGSSTGASHTTSYRPRRIVVVYRARRGNLTRSQITC